MTQVLSIHRFYRDDEMLDRIAPRRPSERLELMFGPIGIAAVSAALAASRPSQPLQVPEPLAPARLPLGQD